MSGIIVHEWITKNGGAEKVLDAMVDTFPDAKVWCLWNDVPESRYPGRSVHESWLASTPLRHSKTAALPLMPLTWRMHRSQPADWILASSHLFAHHVSLGGHNPDVRKFAYVYTPARYIWYPELDGRGAGWLPRLVSPSLRRLDRRRAQESYQIAAISQYVRKRIQAAWDRDSEVIYPPVDVTRIKSMTSWPDELGESERVIFDRLPHPFVLGASRFIPYKRLDLVIKAGEAADLPVVLAGSGPDEMRLRAHASEASVPVHFVSSPSDTLLYALYEAASVFIFPAIEDFGIMPVEAMAAGTPVVTRAIGGASETVVDGLTGAQIENVASPNDYREAIERALRCRSRDCKDRAEVFAAEPFGGALETWLATE